MMRSALVILVLSVQVFAGCNRSDQEMRDRPPAMVAFRLPRSENAAAAPAGRGGSAPALDKIPTDARRIIRTAELTLETQLTNEAQKKVTALAADKGGFVVSSETQRYRSDDGGDASDITIVLRVPSPVFEATLEQLRAYGTRVSRERVSGQDVTEEYLDVEARLRSQRAVEEQFLSILKQAKTVHDTLEVQEKLGEVRGEIERAEGRRRFLESQTSLSTITVHLSRHVDSIDAEGPGFGRNLKRAWRDAIELGMGTINGIVRGLGAAVPVVLLVVMPLYFLIRLARRRRKP